MKCLLLCLALEYFLAIEDKLAVGIRETVAICSRQVCSIENIDTKVALIIDTLRRIELHLDRKELQADSDVALATLAVLECEFLGSVLRYVS